MSPKKVVVARVWEKAVGRPFSLTKFVEVLTRAGGYDMHELSQGDLIALMEDRFEGNWSEVAWSFRELAYYLAACIETDGKLEADLLACWVAWALITGELVRRGHSAWTELDMFLSGLHVLRKQLHGDEITAMLGEAFRGTY